MKLPDLPQKLIILGLTLLAFGLRAYRLDFQSYWIDETWTVFFANLWLGELWHALQTVEIVPPFYHVLAHFWIKLAGDGEYGLRFYSLIFGVLAVPLTYRLGKDLGDARLGLVAALLLASAPYQIWHSQEARMYSLLTAASALSMWGFINLWRRGGWRWWLVYVIGAGWAIVTHYHGAALIGIQGLFLLLTWRCHWRGYLGWAATLLVIFLLNLPWLLFRAELLQGYLSWLEQPALGDAFVRSAIAYSVGELVPREQAIPLTLVFVIVYGLGLIYAVRRRWGAWSGPAVLALLLSYTIAPILAAWVYGEIGTTVFFERYLILIQVGYLLTVAMGVLAVADGLPAVTSWGGRRAASKNFEVAGSHRIPSTAAGLLLLGLVGICGWVLYHHYVDPAYAKPDWRAVARKISDNGLPGDAILLTGDGGEVAFNYYYHGELPVYYNFNLPPPTSPDYRQGRKGPAEADQIMAGIAANHRRIWYTPYGADIDPMLERWLSEHTYPAWHSWLGRKQLALYGTGQIRLGRHETLNMAFSNGQGQLLTLIGAALPAATTAAGDLLPLELTWQTDTRLDDDYQLSLRLVNQYSDVFAQSDWPPLTALSSTSTWPPTEPIGDRRGMWLPPDVPPGRYALQFIVYEPSSGQPLGQPAILADIPIGPAKTIAPLEALTIPNQSSRDLGDLTLLGYALPEKIQPGQEMWLWLYWQAQRQPQAAAVLRLSLSSQDQAVTVDVPLADSVGPLDTWQPGQVRRAVYHLSTSPRLMGDKAELAVALLSGLLSGPSSKVEAGTALAQVELESRSRRFEVPAIPHTTDLTFGRAVPQLKLIGYDLPAASLAPGEPLSITLYWQGVAEIDINYTVFVQLLNQAGQVVAQQDQQPQAGAAPTTTWLPGEILIDSYTLPVPELATDHYQLIAGLYNPATGERLPLSSGGDFVELQPITVKSFQDN
jgi:4-amino-4-deoxy-L-arabinose transferase-like glycosyltransferase